MGSRNEEPIIEQIRPPVQVVEERNIGVRLRDQGIQEVQNEQPRPILMVNRDQNADEIVHRIRNDNLVAENNLTTMIERIMAQNGLNSGFRRPNYTSHIIDYIMQTELPRGVKVPKFTKFAGDTSESTVEHIARYLTEAGDIENDENLRIKYFPSSLTKNTFTWFTTLPPGSVDTWPYLERLFHEQFYMGQSKINLKELASIKRKFTEPIYEYLNRFRLLKSRCFTVVPEHELVEMAVGGLDYSIRKKLDTQYLRDMAQLADRGRQVERLKAEKARVSKNHKKERIAYIEAEEENIDDSQDPYDFDQFEIDLAELKEAPPYACKVLLPSNGKDSVESERNDKFPKKIYTFDITKCDEIFDLLVKDGQLIVPPNLKVPPLEQRKKRGFCKYHNFLGHKTSQCFLFRDLIQNAIKDGRLKFSDKGKNPMKVGTDLLLMVETNYAEPLDINVVEIAEGKVESKVEFEEDWDFILIKNEREATDGLPLIKNEKEATDGLPEVLKTNILSDKK